MSTDKSLPNGNATPLLINGDGRASVHKIGLGGRHGPSNTADDSLASEGRCSACLRRVSGGIVDWLENCFYRLGKLVARNPWKFLVTCVVVCGVAGIGLTKWHEETEYVKVWLPRGSRMYEEHEWVMKNFPESIRYEAIIIQDENVLSPQSVNAIFDIYQRAKQFAIINNSSLEEICIKTGPVCRVNSILELWAYNETVIRALTSPDILNIINQPIIVSPLYRNTINIDKILGDIQRDNNSYVIGARATTMFWYLKKNDSCKAEALDWEKRLIELINEHGHRDLDDMYIYTARTFDDEAIGALATDLNRLSIGFCLVFIYLAFTVSKYSCIEQKVFLAIAGLLSIGMAIVFTYGVGFATGIMFGPIHQITPFMLLGIGVDDMFVIMESIRQLSPQERALCVEERIGLALKHAGVSITVTSITDIVAFAIGGSTVIPSLSTFCVYAAIGVLALYILQATFFVACVTFDERRIDAKRNACCMCVKHDANYKPGKYYNFSIQHEFMRRFWGPFLTKTPVKAGVIIIAVGLSALNIWSFLRLKQDFDPTMYLPSDSYSQKYVKADREYFPDDGVFVQLYCDQINYNENIDTLRDMYDTLKTMKTVQSSTVDFWLASFLEWQSSQAGKVMVNPQIPDVMLNMTYKAMDFQYSPGPKAGTTDLLLQLLYFLTTDNGRVYWRFLRFDNMTKPTKILASALTFRHIKCTSAICNIQAMDEMIDMVDNLKFNGGGQCFVYSNPQYMFNETNKVLKLELYRNLLLAAVCVFVVTLILIANLWTSVLVFLCVVFTVIDVAGTMQFWDISIDTASSVLLILCVGLAVDYSAHVGHTFMTHIGSKNERTMKTLVHIGPAVFSGGFSTFLAFLLLFNSISYGFTLFFRIFTSVVIFGLFHGLVFLPVILSIVGPEPYDRRFLSPLDTHPNNINVDMDYELRVTNNRDDKKLNNMEVVPLRPRDVSMLDIFCKEFPRTENGHMCNYSRDIPMDDSDSHANEYIQNPRYSGSYYEQLSTGSLVEIPYLGPDSPDRPTAEPRGT
ncbi:patched domain-containing protein 3-like isoform X2 [Dreissena polymorpha]|nr:patched domain-containing protein 3-like isoform X2 [Dreissena polymorpha]XP_052274728.1 patched domain-containing protein 3-like isoform X2 [Dreissena polymorpha]XP_052274729.1 patched domain-containing protein 3-like isoform X2 [Dreissena polymorpha]XP_052274731.1 patched domain-containing protein 3-like isoform X2 [Dreissena polymorpha]XP_052274732.1 patched domain-containing protein 3-like isoform X2 [Dreissena polymorpha]